MNVVGCVTSALSKMPSLLPSFFEEKFEERTDFKQFVAQVHNLGENDGRLIVEKGQLRHVALQTGQEAEEQNKKTWAVFKRAVEAEFDQSQILRICEQCGIEEWGEVPQRAYKFNPAYVDYFAAGVIPEEKVAPKEKIDFRQFIVQVHNLGKNGGRLIVKNGQLRNVALQTGQEAEEQNKEIWAAFKEAVESEFEQNRIRRICEQHGIKDWDKVAQRTYKFDPAHVECFGAGAALVKDCELEDIAKKPLSAMTLSELRAVYEKGTANAYLGEQKNPKDLHGAPYALHEQAKRNPLLESQRLGTLLKEIPVSKDPNLPRLSLYYSRLAMAIICLFTATEQDVGKVIPAPGPNEGELDFFKVHSVVSRGGLTAYFLVPIAKDSTLAPTVVFRCTNQAISQNNAMHSVKNCFAENIGEDGWLACKEEIAKVMQDPTFTLGKKITTLSYSLGGSHQGYFVREYLDQIDEVYAFNAVGNDKAVALAIAEKVNKAPPSYVPPSIYHIRNIHNEELGDFVNVLGMRPGCKFEHPNAQVVLIERVLADRPPPDPADPMHEIALKYYHAKRLDQEQYRYNIYRGAASYKKLNPDKYKPEMEKRRKDFRSYFDALWVCYELVEFVFALFNIKLFHRQPSKRQ